MEITARDSPIWRLRTRQSLQKECSRAIAGKAAPRTRNGSPIPVRLGQWNIAILRLLTTYPTPCAIWAGWRKIAKFLGKHKAEDPRVTPQAPSQPAKNLGKSSPPDTPTPTMPETTELLSGPINQGDCPQAASKRQFHPLSAHSALTTSPLPSLC